MTLYLKYRPQDFNSVVGQEFINNTLRNSIKNNNLVGAYLFCGPRGTGKTSLARIFAKSINCLHPIDGNPCLKCSICRGFYDDNLVDIIEIDAASYTGVDNIRDIIERAKFMPTLCKYKVYIIDEVHMLSKGAFNALLKILEEPPEHLKFILATTDVQKIPDTILSRCQRYDFKKISKEDIITRLQYIAKNEGIKIDIKSLSYISQQSGGGLRNAISLFEQLIINKEIHYDAIIKNYGIPKNELLESFFLKIYSSDISVLDDFTAISKEYNLTLFFKSLLFLIKDKLIENLSTDKLKRLIFILETLDDSFSHSKVSFDENTSFLVGVIKCIKGYTKNDFLNIKESKIEKNILKTSEKKSSLGKKEIVNEISDNFGNLKEDKKEKINFLGIDKEAAIEVFGDIENNENNTVIGIDKKVAIDVFGDSGDNENKTENKEKKEDKNLGLLNIQIVKELKNIKAKGVLITSLKDSKLEFSGNNLIIYSKNELGFKKLNSNNNPSFISKALENLGYLDCNIEIK